MRKFFEKLSSSDWRLASLIVVLSLLSSLPALWGLEYLRHTEADRTLIGWEMYKTGNYLLPHLLGDLYITKPPLFYWLLAGVFSLTGEPWEWAARLVSLLGASFFLAAHFILLRRGGATRSTALLSAVILGTNFAFFTSSVEAEIDMTLLVLSGLSLHFAFLSLTSSRPALSAILCWFFAALAFLTKGPPIFVFLGAPLGLFLLYETFMRPPPERISFVVRHGLCHLLGVIIFLGLAGLWFYCLQSEVPLNDLKLYFDQEILRRFRADPVAAQRNRGLFFYPVFLLGALIPWSLLAFGCVSKSATREGSLKLFVYCLCASLPAVLIFSLSSGKSGRYILPIFPFLSYILAVEGLRLWNLRGPAFKQILVGLAVFLIAARLGYAWIYAPIRNAKLSVRIIAEEINKTLPREEPLYILEMFERWLPYYLLRQNRAVYRLSPERAAQEARHPEGGNRLFVLLNAEAESWRTGEILGLDPGAHELARYQVHKKTFSLWQMNPGIAPKLSLRRLFPDQISSPGQTDPLP